MMLDMSEFTKYVQVQLYTHSSCVSSLDRGEGQLQTAMDVIVTAKVGHLIQRCPY